jgi:3-deoxy-D-arabino-heptulosonate 7-phosphate (DAHP) synthase class II
VKIRIAASRCIGGARREASFVNQSLTGDHRSVCNSRLRARQALKITVKN